MEATLNRFNESVSQSVNAVKSLESQFPRPSVPPREVVRCQSCSLVQFRTMSDLCRRCHRALAPKMELDLSEVSGDGVPETAGSPWTEEPNPGPQIGAAIKRLRRMRRMSQGELGRKVGLRRTYLSRVENDHVMPGPRIVSEIARALEIGIEDLFRPQPARGSSGSVLREQACLSLVEMFSELHPGQMAQIVSQARQMCAAGITH